MIKYVYIIDSLNTHHVDASATFKGPARMDDEIIVVSWVDDWKGKTFIVRHDVFKGDEVIIEGKEVRACVATDAASDKGIKAIPIPKDVIAKFS